MAKETAPGGVPKSAAGVRCKCETDASGNPKTGNAHVTARDVKVEEGQSDTQYFSVCRPGFEREVLYKVTLDNSSGSDPVTFTSGDVLRELYRVVTGNNARAIADPPESVDHTPVEVNLETDELTGGSSVASLVFLDVCGIDLRSATQSGEPGNIATSGGVGSAPWFNVLIASSGPRIPLRGPPEKGGTKRYSYHPTSGLLPGEALGSSRLKDAEHGVRISFGPWRASGEIHDSHARWQPGFELVAGGVDDSGGHAPWLDVLRVSLEPRTEPASSVLQSVLRASAGTLIEAELVGDGSVHLRPSGGRPLGGTLLRYSGDPRGGAAWHVVFAR